MKAKIVKNDSLKNKFKINTGYNSSYPVFTFKAYTASEYYKKSDHTQKSDNELFDFLSRMSEFSRKTWTEIKQTPKMFHFHDIERDNMIFSKLKIDNDTPLVQFKLTGDKESRIVGYFDEKNVFSIIAYDYNHRVYPKK